MPNTYITEVEFHGIYTNYGSISTYPKIVFSFKNYTELAGNKANIFLRLIYLSLINTDESKKEILYLCNGGIGVILIKNGESIISRVNVFETKIEILTSVDMPSIAYSEISDIELIRTQEENEKAIKVYKEYLDEFYYSFVAEKTAYVWKKIKTDEGFINILFWEDINYRVENGLHIREFIDYLENHNVQIISSVASNTFDTFLVESRISTELIAYG